MILVPVFSIAIDVFLQSALNESVGWLGLGLNMAVVISGTLAGQRARPDS